MTDRDLIRAAIAASGLSVRAFARLIVRNPRNVWKWRAETFTGTMPAPVREICALVIHAPHVVKRAPNKRGAA